LPEYAPSGPNALITRCGAVTRANFVDGLVFAGVSFDSGASVTRKDDSVSRPGLVLSSCFRRVTHVGIVFFGEVAGSNAASSDVGGH